jgi:hypothetical protein
MIKRIGVLFFLVFCAYQLQAQQNTDLSAKWIEITPADSSVGIFQETYVFNMAPDGYFIIHQTAAHQKKIMEGSFLNEKMQGNWIFYQENRKSEEISYSNDIRNGAYTSYYPSGQIKASARYENGVLEGIYTNFNEDGTVKTKYQMHKGVIIK